MKFTDLAIESAAILQKDSGSKISGITIQEERPSPHLLTTRIQVESEEASQRLHKPCGTYITLEVPDLFGGGSETADELSEAVASELRQLIPFHDR